MPKLVSLKRLSRRKSSSDPDDSDMDDHTIHYEGFLERRSGVMKTYKRAWFQLHGKELRHYKTNPKWESSAPKGTFNVAEIQTVKAMSTQNRHIIQIITPKGTVCLSGESASYCEEWATHLRQAMQRAKKSATSISVPESPPRRGVSMRKATMSTVSEEEEKRASKANAGQEYDLLGSAESTPTSQEEFLYEEVQPVKRQPVPTLAVEKEPDSAAVVDDDSRANGYRDQRSSASSGYSSTEGLPTEQDSDTSVFGEDCYVPALPYPPLVKNKDSSIEQLRKVLSAMGVDATESEGEGDLYMNTSGSGTGIEELKQFLKSKFFVNF